MSDDQQAPIQIDLSGDGGVLKRLTKEGTGVATPADGCTVSCHYTGTLVADGTQFDSSVGREPFEFELGKGAVVRGFELAAASMRLGESAVFTFAPEYAYGKHGSPPSIPGGSTLQFAMEMLAWKAQDVSPNRDGAIERHVVVKSDRPKKTPKDGVLVNVDLTGRLGDRVFDDRKCVDFIVGEVPDSVVIQGVQLGLLHFGKAETSRLVIRSEYAFGAKGNAAFDIPAGATVEYTVTLNHFEKDTKSWQLDENDSIEQAKIFKEKGTVLYKEAEYKLAIKIYEKSNSFLSNSSNEESQKLKAAVFLNIALCQQHLGDGLGVKSACNTVLEIEPNNVKALYRRGQSCLTAGETDAALADFNRIIAVDAKNSAALKQIAECRRIIKAAHEKDKKLYANMFTKFASKDYENEETERHEETDVLAACGEWNMEEAARKEADLAFKEVDQNVVMI